MQIAPPWRRGQAKPFPSIPRINWAHPLAHRLCCYVYDVGGTYYDLMIGGGPGALVGTPQPARGNTPYGTGTLFTATSGAIAMPGAPSQFPAQGASVSVAPWTIASGFFVTAVGTAAGTFALSDNASNNPMGAAVATSTTVDFITSNGVNDMDNVTVPNYLNKYSTISTVATSSSAAIGYFNGLNVVSQALSNACGPYNAVFPTFNTLSQGGLSFNGIQGQVFWGAIWTRALTAQENMILHLDPYALLIFPEDDIFAMLVGASATLPSWGFDTASHNSFLRKPTRQAFSLLGNGSDGIQNPLIRWQNTGFEIAPPQPPHPHPEWRAGAVMPKDDGAEQIEIRWQNVGFEIAPIQPPHPRPEKFGASVGSDQGDQTTFVNWYNSGWQVQPFQPPNLMVDDPNVRFAAAVGSDQGIESQFVNWQNDGWEAIQHQPDHPLPERTGSLAKGEEGTKAAFVAWFNTGWEVQPPQPPHPRAERSGSIVRLDEGIELPFVNFSTFGWEIKVDLVPPKSWRSGALSRFDEGIENPMQAAAPVVVTWGFDSPTLPRAQRTVDFSAGGSRIGVPASAWFNTGWEVAPPQPPHPRPERNAALVGGDAGIEATLGVWQNAGWQVMPPQPPHPKPERAGLIMIGDAGIEAVYVFVPLFLTSWGFEPPPTNDRIRVERAGAIAGHDDGSEAPFVNFFPAGFEIVPPQPPHPRPERFGALVGGTLGNDLPFVNWLNGGWQIAPHQPGHLRPERAAAVMAGDVGIEAVYVFVPPGGAPTWGLDPVPTITRGGSARGGALGGGAVGVDAPFSAWYPYGWHVPEVAGRARPPALAAFQEARNVEGLPPLPPLPPWGYEFGQPLAYRRPLRQHYGTISIEAPFVFVPLPPLTGFVQPPDLFLRVPYVNKGAAVLPFDDGWFINTFVPVFYAVSRITQAYGITNLTARTAVTVLKAEQAGQ